MTFALTRPGGFNDEETITGAEMTEIDEKTADAIDKNGDSVPGDIEFHGSVTVADGYLTVNSDSTVTINGPVTFGTGSVVALSGLTTFGFSRWPLVSSRSVTRVAAPILLGTTAYNADMGDAYPRINSTVGGGVFFDPSDEDNHRSQLAIPGIDLMNGNSLVSVSVRKQAGDGAAAGTMNYPVYRLLSYSNTTVTARSSDQADSASSWVGGTASNTTITATTPVELDLSTTRYAIEIDHPWNTTTPASMLVYQVSATYTVTKISF